jgi:small subunit ribosomal protein S8
MMTDPIADMLTRIRNANRIERPMVDIPATRIKVAIAKVLKDEGFVYDYSVGRLEDGEFVADDDLSKPKQVLRVVLKYGPEGEKVIRHLARASKPGRRLYWQARKLRPVLDGMGIAILSTSRGVLSDRQARQQRVGGEVICTVW